MRNLLLLVGLLLAHKATAKRPESCPSAEKSVTELGRRYQPLTSLPPQVMQTIPSGSLGFQPVHMRLQLTLEGVSKDGWWVLLRDPQMHLIQTVTPASFSGRNVLWTKRIPGRFAYAQLTVTPGQTPPEIYVSEYVAMPESTAERQFYSSRTPQDPRYKPLYTTSGLDSRLKTWGDSVAFLMFNAGTSSWCCTGVAIRHDLVLTNWHCGVPPTSADGLLSTTKDDWEERLCQDALLDFSWDDDGLSQEFTCMKVEAKSPELDYALLRVAPVDGSTPAVPPAPFQLTATPGGSVVLVHHPECRRKQISWNCQVMDEKHASWLNEESMTEFTHGCDTEGGSSGAPVFDANGTLVGLHHRGFEKIPPMCTQFDQKNKAVSMGAILADLKEQAPKVYKELGLQEVSE